MSLKKLWAGFALVMILSFGVLLYFGNEIYKMSPPIPEKVVDKNGAVLFTKTDIQEGQQVWQSIGGHELGSIWGHGAYVAPDWSADWLHREAVSIVDSFAMSTFNSDFESLTNENKALLKERLQNLLRENTYNPDTKTLTLFEERVQAITKLSKYYSDLFMGHPDYASLREAYAMKTETVKDIERMRKLSAFFFWTSWSCVTQRPNEKITYTNNWPSDELVGNVPTGSMIIWTGFSVILLITGIGALSFFYATQRGKKEEEDDLPLTDPLLNNFLTDSMKGTLKYFWVVVLLILTQSILGIIVAHYGVEGTAFYGIPIGDILPYSVVRTWHIQIAIFWIATSWLATGLYVAPAVAGQEPPYQKYGVHFLFVALLIIVVGSMVGEWLGVQQKLGLDVNHWFGHQGYEYIELGRFWQIFLLVGLFLWFGLMFRALLPALKKKDSNYQLLLMFVISSFAIALFYSAGLMIGKHEHLSMMEYWRWWVVHLWVEGFFEVFATVVIAFLFVRLKLIRPFIATSTVLFSTIIFLTGGILGTFHHLYFTGTPTGVMALGASFSALEVVPLVLMGFEGYHNYKLSHAKDWLTTYKWPIYFFISVAFWNFLGAGVFGFLINPPIALYYMQGLNTTPVHGHTALFGVYGMLGIGLMLFVLRGMFPKQEWKNISLLKYSFWGLNIGLFLMVTISVLPVGLVQTWASVEHGLWYARSAELLQSETLDIFRWLRIVGDTIFFFATIGVCYFVLMLKLRNKNS